MSVGISRNCGTRRYYKAIHSKHLITGKRSEKYRLQLCAVYNTATLQYSGQVSCITCIIVLFQYNVLLNFIF